MEKRKEGGEGKKVWREREGEKEKPEGRKERRKKRKGVLCSLTAMANNPQTLLSNGVPVPLNEAVFWKDWNPGPRDGGHDGGGGAQELFTKEGGKGRKEKEAMAGLPLLGTMVLAVAFLLGASDGEGEMTTIAALAAKMVSATASTEETAEVFEPAESAPSKSEAAAVQPVIGIGQRVKMRSGEKKDLGILGYILGVVMVAIIIAIGAGIVVGYVYKRARDLNAAREQKAYEREMQRVTLPLSAFTNQACEIADENTIVVVRADPQTPAGEDPHEGDAPLMTSQAGTPGA